MIIAQRFIAGYGGPSTIAFSPVGTTEFSTSNLSRPYGTNAEKRRRNRVPSTEVLG